MDEEVGSSRARKATTTMSGDKTDGVGLKVFSVPNCVYAATDGVFPQWRFLLVVYNPGPEALTLERVVQTRCYPGQRVRRRAGGDAIRLVQGEREMPGGGVAVLEMSDSVQAKPPPVRIDISLTFSDGKEAFVVEHAIDLVPTSTRALHFPLRGPWLVANGRSFRHCLGRQFGFDFIHRNDARIFSGPVKGDPELTRFASFAQPLFSPTTGRVLDCTDENEDIPATPDRASGTDVANHAGNYLVVEDEEGACVLLAHLRKGSLLVRKGERVEAGRPVAQVGNNGTTSLPHLHIELLDRAPEMEYQVSQSFSASGLPFGFHQCRRVGRCAGGRELLVPKRLEVLEDA